MASEPDYSPFSSAEPSTGLAQQVPEALRHLKAAPQSGVPWHQALLEAIGLWTQPQEEFQGRTYQYLIQGEAFDWLVLAERALRRAGRHHSRRREGAIAFLGTAAGDCAAGGVPRPAGRQ